MKNLFAIPRLSLFAAFTILITLVVCLAGFTGAEVVYTNYQGETENRERDEDYLRKQLKGNTPYLQEPMKTRGEELLKETNFASYLKNYGREDAIDNLMKRHSDDFGESEEFDGERESDDGYGYDDDEYYHFDFKRNDETKESLGKNKEEPQELVRKEENKNQKVLASKSPKENTPKETETIELINFKETHPVAAEQAGQSSISPQITNAKPILQDVQKKTSSSDSPQSLKMDDIKENTAISEKLKENRKDESGKVIGSGTAEQKPAEVKKESKVVEEKGKVKLKESKVAVDSDKKEKEVSVKEVNVKEAKESVSNKNMKEPAKTAEEKETHAGKVEKLSENTKLNKNEEKFSSKSKDGETAKIINEDKSRLTSGKVGVDSGNPKAVSQINNRASFVSSDFKDDPNALKTPAAKEEDKNLDDSNDSEKSSGLSDYRDDVAERKDNLREDERSRNYEYMNNGEDSSFSLGRGLGKMHDYLSFPIAFEIKNDGSGDYYKKRESWKEHTKIQHEPQPDHQQPNNEQTGKTQYRLNFPASELENTDYHKNYIKSLRRYKGMEDSPKVLNVDPSSYNKSGIRESQKRKRSQMKKRKSMMYEESLCNSQENDRNPNDHWNIRRNAHQSRNMLGNEFQSYSVQHPSSQIMPNLKMSKEDADLTFKEQKKYEYQNGNYRWRRGSPQKLEYEIKVINQNQQDGKGGTGSNNEPKRKKKDEKAKIADQKENKNLKKYSYSQVSLDDLTKLTQIKFNEGQKIKRRVSPWEQRESFGGGSSNTKSHVRARGVPSGYYGNRVKFGQKRLSGNDEGQTEEGRAFDAEALQSSSGINRSPPTFDQNRMQTLFGGGGTQTAGKNRFSSVYDDSPTSGSNKNLIQWGWEIRNPGYKHDQTKRFDSSSFFNKDYGTSPLFLVKKGRNGERVAKPFMDETTKEENLDPNQIAKILSQDHDYVLLRRTDQNKLQKVSGNGDLGNQISFESSFPAKKSNVFESMKSSSKQTANRGLNVRSDHWGDENKKYAAKFYNSDGKSGLRKTFEKLKDFADFFKDSEQELADNQRQIQEKKESDIVFSEDRLPDPIVITNEINEKIASLKSKPQNAISSISTNFKTLDQTKKDGSNMDVGKNMYAGDQKNDYGQSTWEPALKNAFPEAKSVNSVQRNGNEIIVLDFNRNKLKQDHGNRMGTQCDPRTKGVKQSVLGPVGSIPGTPGSPYALSGERQVEVIINDGSIPVVLQSNGNKYLNTEKKYPLDKSSGESMAEEGNLAVAGLPDQLPPMTIPFSQLPSILKTLSEKKSNYKALTKKSSSSENEVSPNLNQFLKDFRDLTEINKGSKKGKFMRKRNLHEGNLSPDNFPEPSNSGDPSMNYLGNVLHNLVSKENHGYQGNKEYETVSALYKTIDGFPKSDQWKPTNSILRRQSQWTSAEEKRQDYAPVEPENAELVSGKAQKETEGPLQSKESGAGDDSDYQDELWQELSAASDKIQRLRREGMSKRKLRKTIEDALSFRQRRQSEKSDSSPDSKISDGDKKETSDSRAGDSEGKASLDKSDDEDRLSSFAGDSKSLKGSDMRSESRIEGDSKESPEPEKSYLKSDFESHLSGSPESKNEKEELIGSNESGVSRRTRRHVHRRKRSPSHDIKNKVSRTEVENTILENLAEDNYQSVYSPGIKRKLLSTEDEPEDADSYYGTDGREKGKAAGESRPQCSKNKLNKCIDPLILELFRDEEPENEKSRDRRSLTTAFHSNYKREIDLDESMPNDFQNFLVTSLGGFGSQKREVVKKEEALWEGKETSQDSYNQIADSSAGGKGVIEDSPLEKREAPNKHGSFKARDYYDNPNDSGSLSLSEAFLGKQVRPQDKSLNIMNKPEYEEEKVPTQIRIKIMNGSSKEKKSSKPMMEERETSSLEVDTSPKEKEFFEKRKSSSIRVSSPQKLRQFPKSKFSYAADIRRGQKDDDFERQKVYVSSRPYRRGRRNKKKFVQENPLKPVKDFSGLDEKKVESLIQRYLSDQNLWSTTQKMPASNHLPQVETVYNPSQGTNKAQLEGYRPSKMGFPNHKSSVKNSVTNNDAFGLDEGPLRSYFKDKGTKTKEEKNMKDFEDVDWKPFSEKTRMRQDDPTNAQNFKNFGNDNDIGGEQMAVTSSAPQHFSPYYQRQYYKSPNSGYFYHAPTSMPTNSVYDTIRMRQENPKSNPAPKDHGTSKLRGKSAYVTSNSYFRADDRERPSNRYVFDAYKKPFSQKYKSRDYFGSQDGRPEFTASQHEFAKNINGDPQSLFYPFQFYNFDSSKEPDYFETVEEEYVDDNASKQEPQLDDSLSSNSAKKNSEVYEADYHPPYDMKNLDVDNVAGEDDDEFDDDYEENNEEDDLDDYSLLSSASELGKIRNKQGNDKFQNSILSDDAVQSNSNSYPSKADKYEFREYEFRPAELQTSKADDHVEPETQKLTLIDNKGDVESLGGSLGVLKKVNENSNIFGKNLMKSLNKFNYDETFDKLQKEKNVADVCCEDVNQRKMELRLKPKRSEEFSRMRNQLIYVGKTPVRYSEPRAFFPQGREIRSHGNKENVYYRLLKRNPLNAELQGAENEFEYESEENGKHFKGNIINSKKGEGEKEENSGEDEEDGGTNKRDSKDSEKMADGKENFEDSDEESEDNVLENVIGKYIMRKSMKIAPEQKFKGANMASEAMRKDSDSVSEDFKKHKSSKRSVENQVCEGRVSNGKIIRKRLSAGHLTENNFRKYHKKNFNRKRFAENLEPDTVTNTANGNVMDSDPKLAMFLNDVEPEKADEKEEAEDAKEGSETKRSAMGLFRKLANKDKDTKKVEGEETWSPGFEPLYTDKKWEESGKTHLVASEKEKKPSQLFKNSPAASSQGFKSGEFISERKNEKSKEPLKEESTANNDGPWRVELNKKIPLKMAETTHLENKNSFRKGTSEHLEKKSESGPEGELKAFLVISKNVRTAKRSPNSAEAQPPTSGAAETEVGNSYRRKSDEGAGNPDKQKRSLESSGHRPTSDREDGLGVQVPNTENRISIEEKNRALHDTPGLSEGDSKDEQPPRALRNTEKTSFVSAEADKENPGEKTLSKRRLFNRKSVFPARGDENIIGDGGHLHPETSDYLGQQIVGAILAHVGSDPRFRESIAPGLAVRNPAFQESLRHVRRALPLSEFSDNVQSLLNKSTFDVRKTKRRRTRSGKCHKISKQSRQFLDFLVKGTKDTDKANNHPKESMSSATVCGQQRDFATRPIPSSLPQQVLPQIPPKPQYPPVFNEPVANSPRDFNQQGIANLKRRQNLLLKLIEDYHHLSILEKQNLELHYQYILQELDRTNRALENPCENGECHQIQLIQNRTDSEFIKKNKGITKIGFKEPTSNKSLPIPESYFNYSPPVSQSQELPAEGFEKAVPQETEANKGGAREIENGANNSTIPSFSFDLYDQKGSSNPASPKPPNLSDVKKEKAQDFRFPPPKKTEENYPQPKQDLFQKPPSNNAQNNDTNFNRKNFSAPAAESTSGTDKRQPAIAPETFDLLFPNGESESPAPGSSGKVRVKQSLPKNPRYRITEMGNPFRYGLEHFPTQFLSGYKPSELNKLGTGDAASLQLSLKNHGPWKSNLDLNKSSSGTSNILLPVGDMRPMEVRSSRERLRDPSPEDAPSSMLKGKKYPRKPVFPFRLDKKLYTKKILPFHTLKKNENDQNEPSIPLEYSSKKFSVSGTRDRKSLFPDMERRDRKMCEIQWERKNPGSQKGGEPGGEPGGGPATGHAAGFPTPAVCRRLYDPEMSSRPNDVPF